ncbi:MAG: helix-turn-helix transcriptional regulator [Bacilli bacterium]|nr:helix-turn-helix transcriptional regulator [Bacilli bacterium]
MDLGKKIKELRKSRHLKQDDLAEILGITRGQISNLEHNRRSLSLEQLQKLCNYFKIDMEYFGVSPTAEETISLLERAKLIFESEKIDTDTKDKLYQDLMKIYLKSKE